VAAYYNEIDPYDAQWLRNLISAGHIAPGDVDERSVEDVRPGDLSGYEQCHFFAGIGVWSHSLRLAGWPDSRRVWTGSCPCQPFSTAGKGAGFSDERHLWPAWFHLIGERRPPVIFGEQVAGRNGLAWLDLVQDDMEGLGYAIGAVPAPAAGFGAPHIRERICWVAYADDAKWRASESAGYKRDRETAGREEGASDSWERLSGEGWLAYARQFLPDPNGDTGRMGRLRAYGNAIVAPQAAAFIEAAAAYRP
jgi:DNA (cytosine-5)-methyltransferase 1